MALVNFKKGLRANLPATHTEGTFYVVTDERSIYLDVDASTRIRIGDFQEFATLAALQANTNPSETALYYVADINCLAKWNGSEYVQINRDTGMTSVEVTGDGNAVTAAVYDASGRKLTLTKGATYMTSADVDSKISAKVGEIADKTVKEYVDEKTSGIASDAALNALGERVTAAEGDIDALELKVGSETVSNQIDSKISDLNLSETYDAKGAAAQALVDAKSYADGKDAAISAAKSAADAAQADVDALELKVGTVPADKTVVQMIADAQAAATYDDTQVKADIKANADAIAVLNGDGEGSVDKKITDAFNDFSTKVTDDAVVNSYKELIDWAATHGAEAAEMAAAITAIENILAGIGGDGESATVVAYVSAAIDALKIGDYAKVADLTALAGRVTTAEGEIDALQADSHTHANKAELDLIQPGDKAKWDAAEQNAKDHADGLNTAMDTRVKAIEGDYLKDADKTALEEAISAEATTARAAEKANADAISAEVTRATAAEAKALTDAKAYTDGLMTWGSF